MLRKPIIFGLSLLLLISVLIPVAFAEEPITITVLHYFDLT